MIVKGFGDYRVFTSVFFVHCWQHETIQVPALPGWHIEKCRCTYHSLKSVEEIVGEDHQFSNRSCICSSTARALQNDLPPNPPCALFQLKCQIQTRQVLHKSRNLLVEPVPTDWHHAVWLAFPQRKPELAGSPLAPYFLQWWKEGSSPHVTDINTFINTVANIMVSARSVKRKEPSNTPDVPFICITACERQTFMLPIPDFVLYTDDHVPLHFWEVYTHLTK